MLKLDSFETTIIDSTKTLHNITDVDASFKNSETRWSRKEILGHLIDSANVNYNRIINSLSKDELVFGAYPQNEWVEIQNYNNRDWKGLIELWGNLNIHILELVKNIHVQKLNTLTTKHNFDKICWELVECGMESSLEYFVNDYFGHLEHHVKQIINY